MLVQRLERADVPGFLKQAKWPGDSDGVASVLSDFGDLFRRFRLSMDLSAGGTVPRLAVELYIKAKWGEQDDWLATDIGDWRPVLERLDAFGWCLPEKTRRLLAWPRLHQFYGPKGTHRLYMGVNHVKLLIEHGAIRAKAYTGLLCKPAQLEE